MQKDIATVKKVKKRAKNLRKVANRLTFVAFGRNGLSVMTEKTTLFSVVWEKALMEDEKNCM